MPGHIQTGAALPDHFYGAGTIKRRRATLGEMAAREAFFIDYAHSHGPITVRGLYYQAEVHGIAGIDKTDSGYRKVQAQVLKLRREGRLQYRAITDSSRYMRKPSLRTTSWPSRRAGIGTYWRWSWATCVTWRWT